MARVGVFTPQKLAHSVNHSFSSHPHPQLLNINLHTTVLEGRLPLRMIKVSAFPDAVSSCLCNTEHSYLRMFENFFLAASKKEVQKVNIQLWIRRVYENAPCFSYLFEWTLLRAPGFKVSSQMSEPSSSNCACHFRHQGSKNIKQNL